MCAADENCEALWAIPLVLQMLVPKILLMDVAEEFLIFPGMRSIVPPRTLLLMLLPLSVALHHDERDENYEDH